MSSSDGGGGSTNGGSSDHLPFFGQGLDGDLTADLNASGGLVVAHIFARFYLTGFVGEFLIVLQTAAGVLDVFGKRFGGVLDGAGLHFEVGIDAALTLRDGVGKGCFKEESVQADTGPREVLAGEAQHPRVELEMGETFRVVEGRGGILELFATRLLGFLSGVLDSA